MTISTVILNAKGILLTICAIEWQCNNGSLQIRSQIVFEVQIGSWHLISLDYDSFRKSWSKMNIPVRKRNRITGVRWITHNEASRYYPIFKII